ncbi:adenylate/guanylate cyclase domain-containing protein [Pseudoxanthomonas koreensis]|uniref:adenylate/guanylate cyclase domain-containing protein n=1 Tax=Pseudoxanthomonas koreensis TaxID=266061 RepID=UPI0013907ACB|nr:adenylate/guanylate cyclase domain-containing protein [Pseudoxanthomonas koreensis]KAF1688828.1 adenylate/guanylate cyclase domain-containing protein [Pseudoxanthomonas koreensis]
MALYDDLASTVRKIFADRWITRDGQVVPEPESVGLGNVGVKLKGTVLYADLSASTVLVDKMKDEFAAEVYKAYLHCAAKIIGSEGGAITAYDGDRVMAVFIGGSKNTSAARTALKINWAVKNIINPLLKAQYPNTSYVVEQTVGIATSDLLAARTGIRGANDLVWVGSAANYAAKLTSLPPTFPTRITAAVHSQLDQSLKVTNGRPMWEEVTWTAMGNQKIYRSTWWWKVPGAP